MRSASSRSGLIVLVLASLMLAGAAVRQSSPRPAQAAYLDAARCIAATPGDCSPALRAARQETAEEQLAAKYAPIIMLRDPKEATDEGEACPPEAFLPMPVEVVLGNPRVNLVLPGPDGAITRRAPTAADLYRERDNPQAYLNFPGNPDSPGCTYANDLRAFGADAPAVTYAHIAREKGHLALQYWFYYYFNDWNNQHESDWEMIQLLFAADSAAEALTQEPVRVSFSQHSGGETADWNDRKLRREGDHPIVYASAGSHASYFDRKVYLGLGETGSGLGCDDTSGRAHRRPLEARLVPATLNGEDDPFAWSAFRGRWGQRAPGQNNGPKGPNMTKRWITPVTDFDEKLRDLNVTVPKGTTLGPNAVEIFCEAVSLSGRMLGLYYAAPIPVGLTSGAIVLLAGIFVGGTARASLFRAPMRTLAQRKGSRAAPTVTPINDRCAVRLYWRYLGVFLGMGAIFIPIGVVSVLLSSAQITIGSTVIGLPLVGSLPLLAAFVVMNAAIAAILREVEAGRRPGVLDGYRAVWRHFGALLWGRVKAFGIATLLAITIVGIPFAINRAIRWLFVEQAIILDGADSRTALATSAAAVKGHWWRVCAIAVVLGIIAPLTGPVIAIPILVLLRAPGELVNLLSSLIYAILLPLIFIAFTQLYRWLQARREIAHDLQPAGGEQPVTTG